MAEGFRRRKKVCYLCTGKTFNYKDTESLKRYINERGKILPRRVTGTCQKHQRYVAGEIKKARILGTIPFTK